jgi:hypothetical protein
MKKPYLIQKCNYVEHGNTNLGTITQEYHPEYMGSAEFEFGELPKSLRRMNDNINEYHILGGTINDKQVYFFIKDHDLNEYCDYLKELIIKKYGVLKEVIYFPFYFDEKEIRERKEKENKYKKKFKNSNYTLTPWENVWWDIENDIVFSFDINAVVYWPICLKNSIKYMDENKINKVEAK